MVMSDTRQIVQILGTGSVGSFLSKELSCESIDISFFDSRPISRNSDVHAFGFNGIKYQFPKKSDFCEHADWNFVCIKSYDITDELVEKLSNSNGNSVFIQNGRTIIKQFNNLEDNSILANFALLDVQISQSALHVRSRSPEILVSARGLTQDTVNKFYELFRSTCIQVKFFEDYNAVLIEKFPRWLLTNLLTISAQEAVGFALKGTDNNDLAVLSDELTRVLSGVLEVQIDSDSLLKQVESLPTELTTSSYRDYLAGNQCEFVLEMQQLVENAHRNRISCPSLDAILERL
jgi:ketopantoate reductase